MKNTLKLFPIVCLLILSFVFPCISFADNAGEPLTVNAVESADETNAAEIGADDNNDSDLISEADALTQEQETAPNLDNPGTGVTFAIVPAVIALVLIIAMLVIKKIKK